MDYLYNTHTYKIVFLLIMCCADIGDCALAELTWAYVFPGVAYVNSQAPFFFLLAWKNFRGAVWNSFWCLELRNLFHGGMLIANRCSYLYLYWYILLGEIFLFEKKNEAASVTEVTQ